MESGLCDRGWARYQNRTPSQNQRGNRLLLTYSCWGTSLNSTDAACRWAELPQGLPHCCLGMAGCFGAHSLDRWAQWDCLPHTPSPISKRSGASGLSADYFYVGVNDTLDNRSQAPLVLSHPLQRRGQLAPFSITAEC